MTLGPVDRHCRAHNRYGNPCGAFAIHGGRVCVKHGGLQVVTDRVAAAVGQVEALRGVVGAAQEFIADSHGYGCRAALMEGKDDDCTCGYREFRDALAALDAASTGQTTKVASE